MNFKQQLIEESKKLHHLERLQEDIEFIKSEMLKASNIKEYTIYLAKRINTQCGISTYGHVTLHIPENAPHGTYYADMLNAIKELGFTDPDIKTSEHDLFYRIQLNW